MNKYKKERMRKIKQEQGYKVRILPLMIIVFLLLALLAFCVQPAEAAIPWGERYSSEYATDYYLHYVEGAAVGTVTWFLLPDKWELKQWQKSLISIGTAVVFKGVFEVFDDGADYRDVIEVWLGATAVVPILVIKF